MRMCGTHQGSCPRPCAPLTAPSCCRRCWPWTRQAHRVVSCQAQEVVQQSVASLLQEGSGFGDAGRALLRWTLPSLVAYIAAGWPTRPRGWCRKDLLEVRASAVQGLGVFARVPLAEGMILGGYPGRPRTPAEMAAKVATAPSAASYCFQTSQGWVLDPTDRSGQPSEWPSPGMPWPPVDATLCRINEPPPGSGGPNVAVEDDPRDPQGLLFVTSQPVAAGEELLLDYGPVFNRSGYGAGGPQ